MVVLTLHRDMPLDSEEIQALPPGCFPVLSDSDVVARAELNLPVAHVARFAAAMARAIPDADFSAESRPTARGVRVIEAGALSDPLWAWEPALPFRTPMPSAHDLAAAPGTPRYRSEEEDLLADDDADFDVDLELEDDADDLDDGPPPRPSADDWVAPTPPPRRGREVRREMGLDELIQRADRSSGPPAGRPSAPPREAPPPPPPLSGVQLTSDVPPELMAMLQRMQAMNGGEVGQPDEAVEDDGWLVPPPRPDLGPPPGDGRSASGGEAAQGSWGSAVPQTGPAAVAAAVDEAWAFVESGEEVAAEGAFLLRGLQPSDGERLSALFAEESGERVALACRVARWLDWPGGVQQLQRAASHPAPVARLAAVQAYALHGGPDVEPMLHILSRDADAGVRSLAQRALKRITGRSRL